MPHATRPVAPSSSSLGTRRTAFLAGVLGLVVAGLAVLALTLGGSDATTARSSVSEQPASLTDERPVAPGTRFDGGPEEGTRGPAAVTNSPNTRFDGGPEEGTRGPTAVPSTPSDGQTR